MVTKVGSAEIEVRATTRRLDQDMRKTRRKVLEASTAIERSFGGAGRSFRGASDAVSGLNRNLDATRAKARGLQSDLVGLAAVAGLAAGARGIADMADEYALLTARLRLVVAETENLSRVQADLFAIAQQNRAGAADIVNIYTRLRQGIVGLGDAEAQNITRALAQSLAISGASASETAAFLRQISQALASGVLRGDEFNSVMENNSRFARLLADELGVGVGALRKMAEEGRLTSDVIRSAIASGGAGLSEEFAQVPLTIAGAFVQLGNALARYVGHTDQAQGASARLAQGVSLLADNFEEVADAIVVIGSAFVAGAVGGALQRAIQGTVASLALMNIGAARANTSVRALAIGAGLASSAFRGLIGILGGPVGAILATIATTFLLMRDNADRAAQSAANLSAAFGIIASARPATEEHAEAVDDAADAFDRLNDATEKAAGKTRDLIAQQYASARATDAQARAALAFARIREEEARSTIQSAIVDQENIARRGIRSIGPLVRRIRERERQRDRLGANTPGGRARQAEIDELNAELRILREEVLAAEGYIRDLRRGLDAINSGGLRLNETPDAPAIRTSPSSGGSGGAQADRGPSDDARRIREWLRLDNASPIQVLQTIAASVDSLKPEEVGQLIDEVMRLPLAFGTISDESDPERRLALYQRRVDELRAALGELANTGEAAMAFERVEAAIAAEISLERINQVTQAIEQFRDEGKRAREEIERLQAQAPIFAGLGGQDEYARAVIHYLEEMARAAGDATEALEILNGTPLPDGMSKGEAERRIRDASREGRADRDERENRFFRREEIREEVSEGLKAAARSGDWQGELRNALADVFARAMDRAIDNIVDIFFGAFEGGGFGLPNPFGLFDITRILTPGGGFGGYGIGIPGFRAGGGSVSPGRAYVAGEAGPEILIPTMPGQILSNRALRAAVSGGGGAPTVQQVINIDARGAQRGVGAEIQAALAKTRVDAAALAVETVYRIERAKSSR